MQVAAQRVKWKEFADIDETELGSPSQFERYERDTKPAVQCAVFTLTIHYIILI